MTHVVAKVSPTVAVPTRLTGRVALVDGLLSITYKQPGMVKTNNLLIPPSDAVAYMEDDTAGFAIVLVNEPIAQFFGKIKQTNEGHVISTPDGQKVYVNSGIAGVLLTMSEADEESREARMALRAAKVKSKVKASKEGKKAKKSKGDDEAPKKKKKKSKK